LGAEVLVRISLAPISTRPAAAAPLDRAGGRSQGCVRHVLKTEQVTGTSKLNAIFQAIEKIFLKSFSFQ
jgi:hypothetical protein